MHVITLPSRCDLAAARNLHPGLGTLLADGGVAIDGSQVAQLGLPVLQLLVSARQTADRRGHALTITLPDRMQDLLKTAGIDPDMLAGREARP
jgi:ABC-type taurine transport system substrate-binding protein